MNSGNPGLTRNAGRLVAFILQFQRAMNLARHDRHPLSGWPEWRKTGPESNRRLDALGRGPFPIEKSIRPIQSICWAWYVRTLHIVCLKELTHRKSAHNSVNRANYDIAIEKIYSHPQAEYYIFFLQTLESRRVSERFLITESLGRTNHRFYGESNRKKA